jgi:hypothetical protein
MTVQNAYYGIPLAHSNQSNIPQGGLVVPFGKEQAI